MQLSTSILSLIVGASIPTQAITLSGKVIDPSGAGKAGVTVILQGTTPVVAAATDDSGAWSLPSGNTGIPSILPSGRHVATGGHLRVNEGHLRVSLSGHDLMGRPRLGDADAVVPSGTASEALARATAPGIDTLLYSWNGKTFLRDTVSTSRSGIVAIFDTTVNASILYGWLTDARDSQIYRTVTIGTQAWMAQNLNYRNTAGSTDTVGVCYSNLQSNCTSYGRLYTWSEVMAGAPSSASIPSRTKGICPEGWHVPSDAERHILVTSQLDSATAGTRLKSTNGWYNASHTVRDSGGSDAIGFRVLSAGYRYIDGKFDALGYYAFFWSSTEADASSAWNWDFYFYITNTYHSIDSKKCSLSLRCIRD